MSAHSAIGYRQRRAHRRSIKKRIRAEEESAAQPPRYLVRGPDGQWVPVQVEVDSGVKPPWVD